MLTLDPSELGVLGKMSNRLIFLIRFIDAGWQKLL
jgi:hypothetical protein